tara:strand:+ start:2288 stop:2764 length:477 start_codon:yes stop_codon:yes gene_type:complete
MVVINHDVDAQNVGGGRDFPLLADGEYPATIVAAEAKVSRAGDSYLQIQFDLGSTNLWQNLNLWHSTSIRAMEIAKEELNEIGVALGISRIGDSDELIAKRVNVKVETEEAQGDWPAKNKIVGYSAFGSTSMPAAEQPVQEQVTTQTDAPAVPTSPWA